MKIFKNSTTAKVVTGFLGLALSALFIAPAVASADTSYNFTKTLKMGMTDQEVWNLQSVLNMSADTMVSASGVGSKGMETKYFGAKTKVAVVKFQEKYASDILTPNGLTKGTGLVGASTRAKLNSMGSMSMGGMVPGCTSTMGFSMTTGASCAGGSSMSTVPGCVTAMGFSPITGASCSSSMTTPTMGTGTSAVSAMIDSTSPMSGSIVQGQAIANLGTFRLTNSGGAAAKVMSLSLKRIGISSDVTLKNVYLYMGAVRLTDSSTIANSMVNFTDPNGIVTIPAGSSVVITAAADVDTSSLNAPSGATIGFILTTGTTDGGTVGGLPISASIMTVAAAPSNILTANVQTSTVVPTVGTTGATDPQADYSMWQGQLQVNSHDALLKVLRFQQIGSVLPGDLGNFRLFVDGVQVGSAVATADANRYVTFDFSGSPITVKTGSRTVKLLGDIIAGSSRSFQFSLRRAGDIGLYDSQLGIAVTVGQTGGSLSLPVDAGSVAINSGNLTITKTTDSPSGNVVLQGSNVTLGKFNLKASGENMKAENLILGFATGHALTPTLRNVGLYINGSQIGSTQNIVTGGTTFNLGSSLIVMPGHDAVLEVRGDIYNTDTTGGATNYTAGDVITVSVKTASSNVLRQTSLGYIGAPASDVTANQLTVASGIATVAKYTAYSNQTITVPQTAYKLGDFRLTTGSTEGINLNTLTVNFTGTANATTTNNVYVAYGPVGGTLKTTTIKSTVSATVGANQWSVNDVLPINSSYQFAVYGDLNTTIPNAATVSVALQVTGTGQNSGNQVPAVPTAVAGQVLTVGTGAITVTTDASTPVSALAVGASTPKVASFKFSASNDSFTIDELSFHVTTQSAADAQAISVLTLKDGATSLRDQSISGVSATSTGLSINVPSNTSKVIDVYTLLGNIGTGFAPAGANVGVTLESYEYLNSNGVKTRVYASTSANSFYVYKTKPTITNVALPTTVLTAGTQTLYQFSVTADTGGTIAWQYLKFNTATSGALTLSGFALYDAANQSTALTGVTMSYNVGTGVVTASSTIDQEVSGSKTYVLKATVGGTVSTGNSISTSVQSSGSAHLAPTTAAAAVLAGSNFVWSDESLAPHLVGSADYNNDNLVKNLPTDSETLTK